MKRWHALGEALRALRKARDLKQKEIADRSGETIGERTLRAYERGEERPGRDRLLNLLTRPFVLTDIIEINRCLRTADYAILNDREMVQYGLQKTADEDHAGTSQRVAQARASVAHGTSYQTPEAIAARLTELVTTSRKKQRLYVAVGEADFVRAWLSRLVQGTTGLRTPAISGLVILGIKPVDARRLEKEGRLKPRFTANMLQNIEAIAADTGLALDHRFWKHQPEFHGYLYGEVALYGAWALDGLGRMHVMTPVAEVRRTEDPTRFHWMLRNFRMAPRRAALGRSRRRNS
jgi:transcriptional regulator with XRE-family HTH domain